MKKNMVMLFVLILFMGILSACLSLFFMSSGCGSDSGFITGERKVTSDNKERVYYLELPKDYNSNTAYPLVFAFHGLGGDYTSFTGESSYDLQDVVGDEAILVFPNAWPDANDVPKWGEDDINFFDDLYAELEENLCFDTSKVFAVGHSNGAGFTHELGCQKGDILRGIAPVAGALTSEDSACIGQVAVIQIHGASDSVVPRGMIIPTRDYWIAINSCQKGETSAGVDTSCDAYGECDTNFPVQYCEHSGGHEWPAFASEGIWDFFKNLPDAAPSDEKGTGDVENLGKGTANFKISYPSDFEGVPEKMALALYPYPTVPPVIVSPSYLLSSDVPLGVINFGEITEYSNVETTMSGVDYGDYTITVLVYVEGSSYPIPVTGLDYQGFQDITINSDTITLDTPFELAFVDSF
jgi:poly(3-hydroxybutyrate) depolymerase